MPGICENPCATSLDLYFTTFPSASVFTLKTHLQPTAFRPSGSLVSIQVPFDSMLLISDSIDANHLAASLPASASFTVFGSRIVLSPSIAISDDNPTNRFTGLTGLPVLDLGPSYVSTGSPCSMGTIAQRSLAGMRLLGTGILDLG